MVGRASPHWAQIRASARSPFESLVPAEFTRLKYSANRSRYSSFVLSWVYTAPGPSTKRAVTSTQRGSPFILTGAWN